MTGPDDLPEALAQRVRDISRAIHGVDADPDRQAKALELLGEAEVLLSDGEPRRRWYEIDDSDDAPSSRSRDFSTFSGSRNPISPPMRVRPGTLADGTAALIGTVRLDRLREGPPRSVHGGVMAGLFDELLGGAQRLNGGAPGMTGRLTVRYRRPTPLDADLELRAWIHDERRRRVVVRGTCVVATNEPGTGAGGPRDIVTAEAEAIFLRVDFGGLDEMMRERADGEPTRPAPSPGRD